MGNWVNKTFFKSKVVKIRLVYPDRRCSLHWVIPNGKVVQIKNKYACIIDEDRMVLEKNIPTYLFNVKTTEPFDALLLDPNKPTLNGLHTAETFSDALNPSAIREFVQASKGKFDINMMTLMLLVIVLIGLIVLGYFTYTKFEELTNLINTLQGGIYT